MKVSYRWLKEYVDFPWSPTELAEALTMAGLEVEGVENLAPDLDKVYVGEVLSVEAHPNGNLKVCQISIGEKILQIVCGAPNVAVGQKVPVAVEGCKLPDGMEIKATELRGVMSYGMACSEKELGLGDDHSGLMVLPDEVEPGQDLVTALGLDDQVLDVSVYANRPDCMSVLGIAREVAALAGTELRYPEINLEESDRQVTELTSVEVQVPEKCPRYSVRIIENVKIGPSPLWMQQKLHAAGMRPINNVVDITNFVMLETGQPLHAFDYDKLAENRIVVRTPEQETSFVTLDGQERQLNDDVLLICDAKEPVCIGGVMGGENSEVTDNTRTILLESANFAAANIRRTSRRLSILSEAALRFEKGIDPAGTIFALNRAAQLLAEYASGQVAQGIIDVNNAPTEPKKIALRPEKVNHLLGTEINEAEMLSHLKSLGLTVEHEQRPWVVTIPAYRTDLELECDLIEEIARLWGYDKIPVTLPQGAYSQGGETLQLAICDKIRTQLVGLGLNEVMNFSFHHPRAMRQILLGDQPAWSKMIKIANPLNEDYSVMRTSLIPGLLDSAVRNITRQQPNLSFFELSSVYLPEELPLVDHPKEERRLGILLTGNRQLNHWNAKVEKYDFYDLKGLVEFVLESFQIEVNWEPGDFPTFHPGRQAQVKIGEQVVVRLGEIHPIVLQNYDLNQRIYVAEVNIETLIQYQKDTVNFQPLARYPMVERDLAIIVDQDVPVGHILTSLQVAGGKLLKEVAVFDVYQGEQVEKGKKSVAFSFVFQGDRTLTDGEINQLMDTMYQAIKEKYQAVIR